MEWAREVNSSNNGSDKSVQDNCSIVYNNVSYIVLILGVQQIPCTVVDFYARTSPS